MLFFFLFYAEVIVPNSNVEHFKTRFSVHRIRELVPLFNNDYKLWIKEAGLGALLAISEFSIPVKLIKWIMRYVDPFLREFRLKNSLFAIFLL